jgi:hypothetical protein
LFAGQWYSAFFWIQKGFNKQTFIRLQPFLRTTCNSAGPDAIFFIKFIVYRVNTNIQPGKLRRFQNLTRRQDQNRMTLTAYRLDRFLYHIGQELLINIEFQAVNSPNKAVNRIVSPADLVFISLIAHKTITSVVSSGR